MPSNKNKRKNAEIDIDNKKPKIGLDEVIKKYKLQNIQTLDDLTQLIWFYLDKDIDPNVKKEIVANIDFDKIFNILESVVELTKLTGMDDLKNGLAGLIRFYLTGIIKDDDMKHMVIYGPPGCGKTTVIDIIAKILKNLGILSKGTVRFVKVKDLIGKFVGHTAPMTSEVLKSCLGGIMVIDEAYSLGRDKATNQGDGFTKECLDVINQFLSENKKDFICIIAGYKEEIEKCFFAYNAGLERRFPFKFTIKEYSHTELLEIFKTIISRDSWKLSDDDAISQDFFKVHRDHFKFQGGDIESLFFNCKIANSCRIFALPKTSRFILTKEDIDAGYQLFIKNREIVDVEKNDSFNMMYL